MPKKRILVVGAGAAGMSCADSLADHPDRFDVTVVEAQGYAGGQAFSIPIDESRFGASFLNKGVQGARSDCVRVVALELDRELVAERSRMLAFQIELTRR